ncbi:MAG: hypothetical protein PHU25_01375 [Deltaproteobacteria bacterium]|nr:hypothetical protein [Deltaproteobacteria bacterium]
MTHSDGWAADVTRVAVVDPRTGEIVGPASRDSKNDPDPAAMGTRIAILRPSARPSTAEFMPASGRKATGEVTSLWSARGSSPLERARDAACRLSAVLRRRPAVLAVAMTGMVAIALTAALHPRGERPADAARTREQGTPVPELAAIPDVPAALEPNVAPGRATLRAAVDAVAEGRLDEARAIYIVLARENPQERSFPLAADILGRMIPEAP